MFVYLFFFLCKFSNISVNYWPLFKIRGGASDASILLSQPMMMISPTIRNIFILHLKLGLFSYYFFSISPDLKKNPIPFPFMSLSICINGNGIGIFHVQCAVYTRLYLGKSYVHRKRMWLAARPELCNFARASRILFLNVCGWTRVQGARPIHCRQK